MRLYLLITIYTLIFCSGVTAQGGFFGKKTVVSVDGTLRGTLLYNSALTGYSFNSGKVVGGMADDHFIAGGFSASVSHYTSKRFGFGFEFAYTANYIQTPDVFESYSYDEYGYLVTSLSTVEQMRMKTLYFIPRIEWAGFGGNLPIGIIHSFGIGFARSSIITGSYAQAIQTIDGYGSNYTFQHSVYEGDNVPAVNGIVAEYGVKLRFPLTTFMALNVGTTLKAHLPTLKDVRNWEYEDTLEDRINKSMRTSRFMYFMDIRAGLSFLLF